MSVSLKAIQTLIQENGITALSYYFKLGLAPDAITALANGDQIIDVTKKEQSVVVEMSQFFLVIAVICNYNHDKSYRTARKALRNIDADNLIISQEYRCLWACLLHLLDKGAGVITVGVLAHTLSNPDIDLIISYRSRKPLSASMADRNNIANKLLGMEVLDQYLVNPSGIEIETEVFVEHCRQCAKQYLSKSYLDTLQGLDRKNAPIHQTLDVLSNYRRDLSRVGSSGDNSYVFDWEEYVALKENKQMMVDLPFPIKKFARWLSNGEHEHFGISPLSLIIGGSGTGKTLMALAFALEYVLAGYKVLFLTAEQSKNYIMDIFGTMLTESKYSAVRYGDDKQIARYLKNMSDNELLANFLPIQGEPESDFSGDMIKIEDTCSHFLPDIVVVDNLDRYLHKVKASDRDFSNHVKISSDLQAHALSSLQNYGKNIYSLLLVQAVKVIDPEQVKIYPEQYMAGAKQVYANCDRAFFIHRDRQTNISQLIMAKDREDGHNIGGKPLFYDVVDKKVCWNLNGL